MNIKKPELVCPAGDWRALITAVESGADSIYFGIKGLNMRARANNFDISQIKKIMAYLHDHNKKGYLTLNVIILEHQLDKMKSILKEAKEAAVDAVILWDMAVFAIAKQMGLTVHLSTQASVSNSESLEFFASLGVKRVVLARECTLKDIRAVLETISKKNLDCKVETFVHGAMCVSISGRCFMSSHAFGKSANQGECRQPCRREFDIRDSEDESQFIIGDSYVLSPKDLCTIGFIDQLMDAGIHSFKIEGRMRAIEYGKVVISAYRRAIDAYFEGTFDADLKESLKQEVAAVYNRGFSTGFYFGKPMDWNSEGYQKDYEKVFLGDVTNFFQRIGVAEMIVRNGEVKTGDRLLVIGKNTPAGFADAEELQQQHQVVETAKRGEMVAIKLPFKARRNDQVFLWKEKKG